MTTVLLTDDAARDLDEIFARVRLIRSRDAELLDLFGRAFHELGEDPGRGEPPVELLELGIREYRQRTAGPYRIVYRRSGEDVHVLLISDRQRSLQSLLQRRLLES